MTQTGSYHVETIASNMEAEIERLKSQVDLFWDKEGKHYIEYGLKDGMSVIELGSGPGYLLEKLLVTFPHIHVTGLEIDPILFNYANANVASHEADRCQMVEGSIMDTKLNEGSFDFAITRLVLEHLPDPIGAIKEVFRILKPGGKAVFIDNDFEMHIMTHPHIFELRALYDAYCESRYAEGGNPKIGRELPRLLKQGGFSKIDFEVISAHSDIVGDEKFFKSEGIGIPSKLVQDGFLPSKVLGEISMKWRNMIRKDDHSMVRQLYMASGEKPQ
ncbi:class I SAM-dependent methyltransferase [Marininema halotolerans]|uniref:Ubiquinone/menaquinone biosynthesis C-methylase UbiE n=1 Tax=Marininema halotolerans TaxID=1155944 RepID=A0A1I6PQZ8_9BACL|nr:methyltransferase domain-containing protein [Marininema halotolerans]SFS42488.1 Ubiquinone/menaquinone biosynthesis C-methylase UbiE [Marininema halotolerans]